MAARRAEVMQSSPLGRGQHRQFAMQMPHLALSILLLDISPYYEYFASPLHTLWQTCLFMHMKINCSGLRLSDTMSEIVAFSCTRFLRLENVRWSGLMRFCLRSYEHVWDYPAMFMATETVRYLFDTQWEYQHRISINHQPNKLRLYPDCWRWLLGCVYGRRKSSISGNLIGMTAGVKKTEVCLTFISKHVGRFWWSQTNSCNLRHSLT